MEKEISKYLIVLTIIIFACNLQTVFAESF